MINQNHVAEIRTCERVKFDQALYILTMYEKKIRAEIPTDQPIDAQKLHNQNIIHSWQSKWKTDLTKPILNCVTSVEPRIYMDFHQEQNKDLLQYNRCMLGFIRRMRAEHEDQSNFKLIEKDIQEEGVGDKEASKKAINSYLNSTLKIVSDMQKSIKDNEEMMEQIENISDSDDNYAFEIGTRIESLKETIEEVYDSLAKDPQLLNWITSIINIMDNVKESEHGSTLIAAQPHIKQFTYLLHPLMLPIYGNLLREKNLKKRDNHRANQQSSSHSMQQEQSMREKPFKDFFSSSTSQLPKVVFLNLDGFQSQFNLEYARCLRKNLMYISFPKQDIHSKNQNNSIYEKRLYKKLMYNFEKVKMSSIDTTEDDSGEEKRYSLLNNVEEYYKNVEEELYSMGKNYEEMNKNLFVMPLRLKTLDENLNLGDQEQFGEGQTIDVYQSYQILQIFKYFLINQIRQFNPTYILVSYSGRLRLEDNHFVQIMQDLTKLSQYKVIYFPNLTPRFYSSSNIDHEINVKDINYLGNEKEVKDGEPQINYQFFNKIARFLKVTSGTHSLLKNLQSESILSKHRHSQVLTKMNHLMEKLGYEYEQIERIRFKNKELDLIPKLFQEDIKKVKKSFQKLVPQYYFQLYEVLKAFVALHEKRENPAIYKLLQQNKINPTTVSRVPYILDLIEELKDRIALFRDASDRELVIYQSVLNQIDSFKIKHFLEIAEEKYEESYLFYFKVLPNYQLYDISNALSQKNPNVDQINTGGSLNLTGLVDVSFGHPSKQYKQLLHIYDSTKVLYTTQQTNNTCPVIPVLITNHLPLDKKLPSKFSNYCGFLKRQNILKNVMDKNFHFSDAEKYIPEQKKLKLYHIKFFDQENQELFENRFQFRVEWNYVETDQYMILYWPAFFNMVEAVSMKLQRKVYEPPILNQVYVAIKDAKAAADEGFVRFMRANFPDDISPRTGCSAYVLNSNDIYIFGGMYEKSKNYLELQRDITRINLRFYDHGAGRKLQAANIKDTVYTQINKEQQDQKPNSYIRVRREFEFYDLEDLEQKKQMEMVIDPNLKEVIMLGGYGQNFLHPFSMLTYYYYILSFNLEDGTLKGVEKKLVYNRALPINMRNCSKNMGIIKTGSRSKNANGKVVNTRPQFTKPDSQARFRCVYKMEKEDLKFQFQFIFTERNCRVLKEQLKKIDEDRYENKEQNSLRVQKVEGNNHCALVYKGSSQILVNLRIETKDKKEPHKLSNDSISYLNIINGHYICAILKDPSFSEGHNILAQCKVKSIQNENQGDAFICLKPVTEKDLKGDLTLHIVEASNINLIYVLHGHRLAPSDKIYEYRISTRKNQTKTISQIKPKTNQALLFEGKMPRSCYSTFFHKRDDQGSGIICQSYLAFPENNIVYRVDEWFNPESDPTSLRWVLLDKPLPYIFVLNPHNPKPIALDKITFCHFWRQKERRVIIIQYNRRDYKLIIEDSAPISESGEIMVELKPIQKGQIHQLEEEQVQKGSILHKKPVHYYDRGYIQE